jgi:hypothetical protein
MLKAWIERRKTARLDAARAIEHRTSLVSDLEEVSTELVRVVPMSKTHLALELARGVTGAAVERLATPELEQRLMALRKAVAEHSAA